MQLEAARGGAAAEAVGELGVAPRAVVVETSRWALTCSTPPGRSRRSPPGSAGCAGGPCWPAGSSRAGRRGTRPSSTRACLLGRRHGRRSTTCGCGRTAARRPQRRAISAAAPAVSVTRASAAGTRTSSWASCRARGLVVRVPQVVDGVDEALAPGSQGVDQLAELLGRARVEPELQVEDVELVLRHPLRAEHHRRPPLLGGRPARPVRVGVGEPHRAGPVLGGEVADVHMALRHGGDADLVDPPVGSDGRNEWLYGVHARPVPPPFGRHTHPIRVPLSPFGRLAPHDGI